MSYTTRTHVEERLTAVGYLWAADRDRSGTVDSTEAAALIDPALDYAANLVDGAIAQITTPAAARALNLPWLTDRATDIAAYRAATQGGRRVPRVLKEDFERALQLLTDVRTGSLTVPGLAGSGRPRNRLGVQAIQTGPSPEERRWPF